MALPFSSKAVPAPITAAFRSLRFKHCALASWQAYPLSYGHLIFKVQSGSSITPFHRFFIDLFTCPKKHLPYVLTGRRQIIRFFEKIFQFATYFSFLTKKALFNLCDFSGKNTPSSGRQRESRFYNPKFKKFSISMICTKKALKE